MILLLLLLVTWHGDTAQVSPEIKEWFQDQKVPGTTSRCCDDADGETVEEDIRGDDFWIKGGHFPEWTPVPKAAVIWAPNKTGHAVVWWTFNGEAYEIRCFAPGTQT